MVGLLWAGLMLVTGLVASVIFTSLRRWRQRGLFLTVTLLLSGIAVFTIFLAVLSEWRTFQLEQFDSVVFGVLANAIVLGIIVLALMRQSVRRSFLASTGLAGLFSLECVVLTLLGLFLYVRYAFPNIPREFGGGEKPLVELFLSEKLAVFDNVADLPVSADGKKVGPVYCVVETDKTLVITSKSNPQLISQEAIAIDKSLLTAVVYKAVPRRRPKLLAALSRLRKKRVFERIPDLALRFQRPANTQRELND
jgi:hypothetical protein